MGYVDPFKGPSSDLMMCSDGFSLNPNDVNIYLPMIMPYLPLAELYT